MGRKELVQSLRHAARHDDVSEMQQLLKDDTDILYADSFGCELLELSISGSRSNSLKCAAYLISLNVNPSQATGICAQTGITPLHSIAFAICDTKHLTDSEQCKILDAIVNYEINRGCSPMVTEKMNNSSAATPFDILNQAQKNYYIQTKQQYLEAQAKKDLPQAYFLPNRNKSTILASFTHYFFGFMNRTDTAQQENQGTNLVEVQHKTIKCD
jgi:hypothetical protein